MSVHIEGGDRGAGFRFESFGAATLILHGWGFWTEDVARSLGARAGDIVTGVMPGGALILNFEGLHPQRPQGEEALLAVLSAGKRRRVRVCVVAPNAITRLQIRRVAALADVELQIATSVDDALAKPRAQ